MASQNPLAYRSGWRSIASLKYSAAVSREGCSGSSRVNGPGRAARWLEAFLYGVSLAATIAILGRLLVYAPYGFDFTDESFHLISMANPFFYGWSVTQFGFVYHPMYLLLDGNITALRRSNILITFAAGWMLTDTFARRVWSTPELDIPRRLIVSAGFATASLMIFMTWLTGPSYNMLTFAALTIAVTGLLFAEAPRSGPLGSLLLACGGWLAFMAKPTTALALAVCVGAYVVLARPFRLRDLMLVAGTVLILLVASAIAIDGSVVRFADRLRDGLELTQALAAGHSFELRVDTFAPTHREWILFAFIVVSLAGTGRFVLCGSPGWRIAGLSLSAALFIVALVLVFAPLSIRSEPGRFQAFVLCAVPVAAVVTTTNPVETLRNVSARRWLLLVLLLLLPFCFAFGTNTNYWVRASHVGLFWLLAGLVTMAPLVRASGFASVVLPFVLAVQAVAALQVQSGINYPRRQPQPLGVNNISVDLGGPGSTLMLERGIAGYIANARAAAARAGFRPGTPMIDLTGQSPGLLYALGAHSIGQAWMIGGYRGSLDLSRLALRRVSCAEIAGAWVLDEPNGYRRISPVLLESVGADRAADYAVVARLRILPGVGRNEQPRLQELLRPVREPVAAVRMCEEIHSR